MCVYIYIYIYIYIFFFFFFFFFFLIFNHPEPFSLVDEIISVHAPDCTVYCLCGFTHTQYDTGTQYKCSQQWSTLNFCSKNFGKGCQQ